MKLLEIVPVLEVQQSGIGTTVKVSPIAAEIGHFHLRHRMGAELQLRAIGNVHRLVFKY